MWLPGSLIRFGERAAFLFSEPARQLLRFMTEDADYVQTHGPHRTGDWRFAASTSNFSDVGKR